MYRYEINAYCTDTNPRRDLGTPAGGTEKKLHLRPLGCNAHNSRQSEEVYIILLQSGHPLTN